MLFSNLIAAVFANSQRLHGGQNLRMVHHEIGKDGKGRFLFLLKIEKGERKIEFR
jgi:hypothetical protein